MAELTLAFTALGVDAPESWASSQLNEGIPQLTRATILVELANLVNGSVEQALAEQHLPSERLEKTLAAIRGSGISDDDLGLLLKFASSLTVMSVCTLLDGASEISNNPGSIAVSLAHRIEDGSEDDNAFDVDDLGLHESWGEVATTVLGKDVYWW